jgi:hypothetical protein
VSQDRFVEDGRGAVVSQCLSCKHLHADRAWTCDAVPAGIPDRIVANRGDHRRPWAGDHGIRFESRPDTTADYLRRLGAELDGLRAARP